MMSARSLAVLVGVLGTTVTVPAGADPSPAPAATGNTRTDRWGIGVHGAAVSVQAEDTETGDKFEFGGIGLHARFRASRRWEVELAASRLRGELESGSLQRDLRIVTASVLFHINPGARWAWSVVAGFGGGVDHVRFATAGQDGKPPTMDTATFHHGHGRLGGALSRQFDNINLSGQLSVFGMSRNEEEGDGPAFVGRDEPTPRGEGGAQLKLLATYYF